jgi:hypothetical protein
MEQLLPPQMRVVCCQEKTIIFLDGKGQKSSWIF